MGLWTALKEASKGNFNDALNYAFMDEDAITTQKEVNNAQQQIASRQYQDGVIDENQKDALLNDIQRNAYPFLWENNGPGDVFTSELKSNVVNLPQNFAKTINAGIAGTSKFIARSLPWYIWAIIIVALLIYLAPFLKIGMKYAKRS